MFLKILFSATLIVPLGKGLARIWKSKKPTTIQKVFLSISAIAPLVVGLHNTWKKKVE